MLTVETIGRIRREFFVQGKTIKEIARDLRVSRNTVRKIVRTGRTDAQYERETQPRPKLGRWTPTASRTGRGRNRPSIGRGRAPHDGRHRRPHERRGRVTHSGASARLGGRLEGPGHGRAENGRPRCG